MQVSMQIGKAVRGRWREIILKRRGKASAEGQRVK
jgi:hypothetical protein